MSTNRLLLHALSPRSYPLCAVGFKRTREHLLSWKAVLPTAVKEATLSVSQLNRDDPVTPHSGTWLFLYENIPQLKYHNPSIKFSFQALDDEESRLSFILESGQTKQIVTTGLRQKEIRAEVETFIDTSDY